MPELSIARTAENLHHEQPNMLAEALRLASLGLHVFPVLPRRKVPATKHGLLDATTNEEQIRKWWGQNPNYNIGINAGASGIIVIDFDTAKEGFAGGDLLAQLLQECPTRTQQTGTDGFHLVYRMPPGMKLGNSPGGLPFGVDVRGHGGYIVVAPSIHPNGKRYAWLDPNAPIAHLPGFILALLLEPQLKQTAQPRPVATFTPADDDAEKVTLAVRALAQWRAENYHDWARVGMALQSWDDGAGLNLWHEFSQRCPAKYDAAECDRKWSKGFKSGGGITVASLFKWADDDNPGWRRALPRPEPPPPSSTGPTVSDQLAAARKWVYSSACVEYIRGEGLTRAAGYAKTMAALVELAREANSLAITPGLRKLAQTANVSPATALNHVRKFAEIGAIAFAQGEHGLVIELKFIHLCKLEHLGTTPTSVQLRASEAWHAANLMNDAFLAVSQRHGLARRVQPPAGDLLPSLGPAALHIWRELLAGDATIAELSDLTGFSYASVRSALDKMNLAGVALATAGGGRGHAYLWRLTTGADERLAMMLPEMTSYCSGLRWAEHADRMRCAWLHKRARAEGDRDKRGKILLTLDRTEHRAQLRTAQLAECGIKPIVGRPKQHMRWDREEMHREQVQLAADLAAAGGTRADKIRMGLIAGHELKDINQALRPSVVAHAAVMQVAA